MGKKFSEKITKIFTMLSIKLSNYKAFSGGQNHRHAKYCVFCNHCLNHLCKP